MDAEFWIAGGISVFLVVFAGIMSGLTLGLMSLGLVDLQVLQQSGSEDEKKQATAILPVVQEQHQLLVTLLLCNAAAMEALPIFLDDMFNEVVAVLLSVTLVLAFGEVIPQAVCSKHGLAIGANLVWLVRVLMIICWPISYPVGKILDYLLGHNDSGMFRRTQLKALVGIHGQEAGKGGDLTHDETTIIQGALDLTEKKALDSMTPLEHTFALDINSKLDWDTIQKILARGHSRVPVYDGNKRNLVGLLLVKTLVTVRAEDEVPIKQIGIRKIPRVPSDLPLYDILNEFQRGSHMAAVTKVKSKQEKKPGDEPKKASTNNDANNNNNDVEKGMMLDDHLRIVRKNNTKIDENEAYYHVDAGDVIGIITLEDVMEELLQEEIVDETDEYIDVANRIRVAAAAEKMNRGNSLVRGISAERNAQKPVSEQAINKGRQKRLAALGMHEDNTGNNNNNNNLKEPLLQDRK